MSEPFQSTPRSTLYLAATSTTGSLLIPVSGAFERDVLIFNAGEKIAFVDLGGVGVVAVEPTTGVSGSQPVPPGAYFSTRRIDPDGSTRTHIAAICKSGETTDLYVTSGRGL
jgi:hypothetical protein